MIKIDFFLYVVNVEGFIFLVCFLDVLFFFWKKEFMDFCCLIFFFDFCGFFDSFFFWCIDVCFFMSGIKWFGLNKVLLCVLKLLFLDYMIYIILMCFLFILFEFIG